MTISTKRPSHQRVSGFGKFAPNNVGTGDIANQDIHNINEPVIQKDIDIIQAAINRGNRSPIAYHVDESYASSDYELSDSPDDDDSTMESLNHFPRNELGHTGTLSRSVVAGHHLWSCCYLPPFCGTNFTLS